MTEHRGEHPADERGATGKALRRRGLIAGAAALVAGIAAKQTSQPVAAAGPMIFANTATLVTNAAFGKTELVATLTTPNTIALSVDASPSVATYDAIGRLAKFELPKIRLPKPEEMPPPPPPSKKRP